MALLKLYQPNPAPPTPTGESDVKKEMKSVVYIYRDSDHQDIKVFRNLRDAKACKWGDEEWEGDDAQSSRWEAGEYERIYKCEVN